MPVNVAISSRSFQSPNVSTAIRPMRADYGVPCKSATGLSVQAIVDVWLLVVPRLRLLPPIRVLQVWLR
jgi:hypothetical protein